MSGYGHNDPLDTHDDRYATPNPQTARESADRAANAENVHMRHAYGMDVVRARVARLDAARRNGYHGPLTRADVALISALARDGR